MFIFSVFGSTSAHRKLVCKFDTKAYCVDGAPDVQVQGLHTTVVINSTDTEAIQKQKQWLRPGRAKVFA